MYLVNFVEYVNVCYCVFVRNKRIREEWNFKFYYEN